MVTSVQPNTYAPITPLPAQLRAPPAGEGRSGVRDDVTISSGVSIASAQSELDDARASLDLALGAGREGAALMTQLRDLAKRAAAAPDDTARAALDSEFQTLLGHYGETLGGAAKAGAALLAGESLSVTLDPQASPVTIQGYDLRLKDDPGAEDVVRLSSASGVTDAASAEGAARDADASLARLDAALSRLSSAAQRLNAHDQFLGALDDGVSNLVSEPSDADGARLLALQVRQGLAQAGAGIANAAPQNILALFRD